MKASRVKARKRLGRLGAILLLPLTVLPLVGAIPFIVSAYRSYSRYYQSPPLSAPANVLSAAQRRAFKPLPPFTGAIPVLTYHGINSRHDGYSISQRTFAGQMQMLKLAGFHTISIAQYGSFQDGDSSGLPVRPILLTFDDGRLDSYRGAANVLAREGFKATMFVITGPMTDGNPEYLDWSELRRMRNSGRWDVQPLAYRGHVRITVDPRGNQRPFYASRAWLRSTGEETFGDYQRRVANDLFTLADQFRTQAIPVYSIAVPFGDYGQLDVGNDPRIVPFILGLMRAQFGTVLVQDDHNHAPYSTPTGGPQERWVAHTWTTPARLYGWLRAHDPAVPRRARATPSPAASLINHRTR